MKKILLATLASFLCSHAHAAVLLTESFTYPDGDIKTAPGSPWVSHGGGATPLNVVGGAAFIDQNDTTGGRDDYNAPISSTFDPATDNNSSLYASLMVNFSALPVISATSVNGSYFAHFKSASASEFYSRIFATTTGAAAGAFRVGIANESGTPVILPTDLALNTSYTLVARLSLATDQSTLWVNPTMETDTGVTDTGAISYNGVINSYALRQGTTGTGAPGDISIDSLTVGTSFADVIPEPSASMLSLVALAALLHHRRQ